MPRPTRPSIDRWDTAEILVEPRIMLYILLHFICMFLILDVNRVHLGKDFWKMRSLFPPSPRRSATGILACPSCVLDMSADYTTGKAETPDQILIKCGKNSGQIHPVLQTRADVGANDPHGGGPAGFTGATPAWRSAGTGNDKVFELRQPIRHGFAAATAVLKQSRRDDFDPLCGP